MGLPLSDKIAREVITRVNAAQYDLIRVGVDLGNIEDVLSRIREPLQTGEQYILIPGISDTSNPLKIYAEKDLKKRGLQRRTSFVTIRNIQWAFDGMLFYATNARLDTNPGHVMPYESLFPVLETLTKYHPPIR